MTEANQTSDTVIQVKDVSMHFNMAADNINSIREYLTKLTQKRLFFEDFIAVNHVSFEVKKEKYSELSEPMEAESQHF